MGGRGGGGESTLYMQVSLARLISTTLLYKIYMYILCERRSSFAGLITSLHFEPFGRWSSHR